MGDAAPWLMLLLTGAIAAHGLAYRDAHGQRNWVHQLVGGVALAFFLRVLFVDMLGWG